MTKSEAISAMTNSLRVQGEDDEGPSLGLIVEIIDDDTALVAWQAGVRTPTLIAELRPAAD